MATSSVFMSAVPHEFDSLRNSVADTLRARGILIRGHNEVRRQTGAGTPLRKLHDFIRGCSGVVCIVGSRAGACPTATEAAPFAHLLPSGIMEASYLQWEFWFARHYRRPLSICMSERNHGPDAADHDDTDRPELQQGVRHLIEAEPVIEAEPGLDLQYFRTEAELCELVLRQEWIGKPDSQPIALPYASLGPLFKGRDACLQRLRRSLSRSGVDTRPVVGASVYGAGGVGKTRFAVEYAWAHQLDHSALLFVSADSPGALRRNLAALAKRLLPSELAAEEGSRVQAVLEWLKDHPGWLLILDNVDDNVALAEAERLTCLLAGGAVIMTNRLRAFIPPIEPLELASLAPEDATGFLLERTAGRRREAADDSARALDLARSLGGLPLALDHAGACIAQSRARFADYQVTLRAGRDKVIGWSDPAMTRHARVVAATWQSSAARLSRFGRRLLDCLAWLAPEPVPDMLLEALVPGALDQDLRDALDDLAAYALIDYDDAQHQVIIHRLVQDAIRRSLSGEGARRRLIEALGGVDAVFLGDPRDPATWPRLDVLLPHAQSVLRHAEAFGIADPAARLMHRLVTLSLAKSLHADAEPLARRVLEIDESSVGPDHPRVASDLGNLGEVLRATGRLAEAAPLLQRALAIDTASFGPSHPRVLQQVGVLAQVLHDTGRFVEAEPLLRRALAIDEASLGPDHPGVVVHLNRLASALQATFCPAAAEPLIRRALAIDQASFGPNHPNVAIHLNNLARLLQSTGRVAEAEPLMRRHLIIFLTFERDSGQAHPNRDAAMANYAALLEAMGKSQAEIVAVIVSLVSQGGLAPTES